MSFDRIKGMLRFSLFVSAFLALTGTADGADPCLLGDSRLGPNCVHEEKRTGREPLSYVYRIHGKEAENVWFGPGEVVESYHAYIIVLEFDGRVRYDWNGSEYE